MYVIDGATYHHLANTCYMHNKLCMYIMAYQACELIEGVAENEIPISS